MIKIDETYDKVDKETTKSFEEKRELLNLEEENLKDKLKNEVTKIKDKFENANKYKKGLKIYKRKKKI